MVLDTTKDYIALIETRSSLPTGTHAGPLETIVKYGDRSDISTSKRNR